MSAQILQIFVRLEYVLPNLIVGSLTRDSIQAAVDHAISASEIIGFLERNAHPRMASQVPVLPETVVNQIHLWAKERSRLQFDAARLYEQFASLASFNEAEAYARDNGVLLWSRRGAESAQCAIAVKRDAGGIMKSFLRAAAEGGGG